MENNDSLIRLVIMLLLITIRLQRAELGSEVSSNMRYISAQSKEEFSNKGVGVSKGGIGCLKKL